MNLSDDSKEKITMARSWATFFFVGALALIGIRCAGSLDVAVQFLRRLGFGPPLELSTTVDRKIGEHTFKVSVQVRQGPDSSQQSVYNDFDSAVILGQKEPQHAANE